MALGQNVLRCFIGLMKISCGSCSKELTEGQFSACRKERYLSEVKFEEGMGLLSTGYQALVRILLELLYYEKNAVDEMDVQHPWIVIDEIDEFYLRIMQQRFYHFASEVSMGLHWLRYLRIQRIW